MQHKVNLFSLVDKEKWDKSEGDLAKLPVTALQGIGDTGANAFEDAFGIKNILDLANNKFVDSAMQIVKAAGMDTSLVVAEHKVYWGEKIKFKLILKPKEEHEFRRLPERHNHFTYGQRFGANSVHVMEVIKFADENDLTVSNADIERRYVELEGYAGQVGPLFGIYFLQKHQDGKFFQTPNQAPEIPEDLANLIEGVIGLDSSPAADGDLKLTPHDVTGVKGWRPEQIAKHYNFPEATGKGQTIAIISLGGVYSQADFEAYFKDATHKPNVSVIHIDGAQDIIGADSTEVMMDVEVVAAVAPESKIIIYHAPNTVMGLCNAIGAAIYDKENKPEVLSISWGLTEDKWSAYARQYLDNLFKTAASLGISVLAASGDKGAFDGVWDGKVHVNFPASSPHVTGCGGTTLNLDDPNAAEIVWNNTGSNMSTGGGFSRFFQRPVWQNNTEFPAGYQGRGVPDLAASSNPDFGYKLRVNGKDMIAGGTSAVAPLMAGFVARVNELRGTKGALGFLNPIIYALNESEAFNDTVSGNNGKFFAGKGWDACTGLGSPKGNKLSDFLVSYDTKNLSPLKEQIGSKRSVNGNGAQSLFANVVDAGKLNQFTASVRQLEVFNQAIQNLANSAVLIDRGASLLAASNKLRNELMIVGKDLKSAENSWIQMPKAPTSVIFNLYSQELLSELKTANQNLTDARNGAAELHTLGAKQLDYLTNMKKNLEQQKTNAQARYNQEIVTYKQQIAIRNSNQSELEGAKGFGNGILIGITGGLYYIKIKKNIDVANAAANAANQAARDAQNQLNTLNSSIQQLQKVEALMGQLALMVSSVTDFQNLMARVYNNAQVAASDAQKLANTSKAVLINLWQKRLINDMAELSQWQDALAAGLGLAAGLAANVVMARSLAVPNFVQLYSPARLKAMHFPLSSNTVSQVVSNTLVQKGPNSVSGFLLYASDLAEMAPKDGEPLVATCDVLRLDTDLELSAMTILFARRIEVNGYQIILNQTDRTFDFFLYVQQLRDNSDQDTSLLISRVSADGSDEQKTLELGDLDGETVGLAALNWSAGKEVQQPSPLIDPALLNEGDPVRVFITALFQVSLTYESRYPELAFNQNRWIAAIAKVNTGIFNMALEAGASANRISALMSMGPNTLLVPPLDTTVYKDDITAWMSLLNAKVSSWEQMMANVDNGTKFVQFAKTFLANSREQLKLATSLQTRAEGAQSTATKAWNQSYNELALRRKNLGDAKLKFELGIIDWKNKESEKAGFKLAFDSIKFVLEVAKLVGEVVFAPELAAPDAAKVAGDVMSAGSAVVTIAAGAAASGRDSQSMSMAKATIKITPAQPKAPTPPTTTDKAKKLAKKIGGGVGSVATKAQGVVGDIQNLIAIGKQAEQMRVGASEVSDAVGKTFAKASGIDLSGVNPITGGQQYWDDLTISIKSIFQDIPKYKEISGGTEFYNAFLYLITAAKVTCQTRLALASAENQLAEAKLRKASAQKMDENNAALLTNLDGELAQNQNYLQMYFARVMDAKISVYLLAERYRRALEYFTLSSSVPPLPELSASASAFQTQVATLTSQEIKFLSLSPIPQVMNDYPFTTEMDVHDMGGGNQGASFVISADTFKGFGRIRFTGVIPSLVDDKGNPINGAKGFELVTSGRYDDVKPIDGKTVSIVSQPTRLTIQPGVEGKLPTYLQNIFFKPTPLANWTVMVNTDQTLPAGTRIQLKFHGEISPMDNYMEL